MVSVEYGQWEEIQMLPVERLLSQSYTKGCAIKGDDEYGK